MQFDLSIKITWLWQLVKNTRRRNAVMRGSYQKMIEKYGILVEISGC
jgi:hypothetical protein